MKRTDTEGSDFLETKLEELKLEELELEELELEELELEEDLFTIMRRFIY